MSEEQEEPTCFRCKKPPSEIYEYTSMVAELNEAQHRPASALLTPAAYVRLEEGTYNSETDRYCCTECYIAIGMPTRPGPGWKAP